MMGNDTGTFATLAAACKIFFTVLGQVSKATSVDVPKVDEFRSAISGHV